MMAVEKFSQPMWRPQGLLVLRLLTGASLNVATAAGPFSYQSRRHPGVAPLEGRGCVGRTYVRNRTHEPGEDDYLDYIQW